METSRKKQIQKNLFTMTSGGFVIVVRNNSVNALVERFVEDQNMVIRLCDKSKLDGLGLDWVGSGLSFLLK